MTDLILEFIPQLANHEYLLILVECLFFVYFGGMIFQLIGGLIHGNRRY